MSQIDVVNDESYFQTIIERVSEALKARDKEKPFHFFLSGGSTPKKLYAGLAEAGLDWSGVHLWWGDERFVPHDHVDSNFRMVRENLIDKLDLPAAQIHAWPILSTPELSAETYDREFREYFCQRQEPLSFQLLGMGDDGHTASLFPGTAALQESEKFCVANYVPGKDNVRLTLTYPALALSEKIVFLVRGEGKAEALQQVLEEGQHPSSKVQTERGEIVYWLDKAASSKLSG